MCPVCGYPDLDEPAYDKFGCASFDICSSCGTQFGYDDTGFSHEFLRREWVNKGCPWLGSLKKAENWDPLSQLKAAGFL